MTREQMVKTNWRPYMIVEFKTPRMELAIECMLLAINFESEVVTIVPVDTDFYEADDVHMSIQYISLPRPQPRKAK